MKKKRVLPQNRTRFLLLLKNSFFYTSLIYFYIFAGLFDAANISKNLNCFLLSFLPFYIVRLTSLEIKGFKSFAEKTVFHFNQNVTGIIGPNGSGKSNVVDAIRWVLGEQRSKTLRSEKMDNIIFNGTKKRSSAGRAEVSLTFENTRNLLPTEFSSVTISRVLYRNGDSEYRINDVACRLKDITALFLDTGISSDSYAIIELGMINEILNDKDDLRRRLFEQAAGISKYKIRKKETLSKLESTDGDLSRVEDLLAEIENNLKTLEKQAKRAERFKKLQGDYKQMSIDLAHLNLTDHKVAYKNIQKRCEIEQAKRIEQDAKIAAAEAELAQHKKDLLEKEQFLSKVQQELNVFLAQIRDKESEKGILTEKIRFARERKDTLQQQISDDEAFILKIQQEIDYLEKQQDREEDALQLLIEKLGESKEQNERIQGAFQEKRGRLAQLEQTFRQSENEVFHLEKEVAVKSAQRDNIRREIQDNRLRFESRQEELETLKENRGSTQKERDELALQIQQTTEAEAHLETSLTTLDHDIAALREQLAALHRRHDARSNEYSLTKSMVESLEGFPDSLKFLKQNKSWQGDSSAARLLSELFTCADPYKLAIEHFLSPYLNYYVVPSFETAHAAVTLLIQQKKGKANFFVTPEITHAPPTLSYPKENTKAVAALDILETENEFFPLFRSLLHGVFICEAEQEALSLSQQYPDAVFLAQNGQWCRKAGAVWGGSVGAFEGKKIGRVQNLQALDKEITQLKQEISHTKQVLEQKNNEIIALRNASQKKALQLLREQLNRLDNKMASFNATIKNLESFIADAAQGEQSLSEKLKQLQLQLDEIQTILHEKKEKSQAAQTELQDFRASFHHIEQEVSNSSRAFNELNLNFHQQQNKINTLHQNFDFYQKRRHETQSKLSANKQLLQDLQREVEIQEQSLKKDDGKLKDLYEEKDFLEAKVNSAEIRYFSARGRSDELEDNLRQIFRQKEQIDALLQEAKDESNRIQMKLLSLKERLAIEFNVDINELMNQEPSSELPPVDALREEVARLKKSLETFGEVNPFAIEAYKEMKERYDFIVAQRNDLLEAKQSLLNTIEEIENTAVSMFMSAFSQVRLNFQEVFRKLFTPDDDCDLTLSQPDNPLESNVNIIAKPKGKRPSSIDQLSGGEKSLTAISLIFGLYLLKPAPFCILDEVDAPLDDANVGKFSQMIRHFSDSSQFIVVTHNKNTMEQVDAVYGIVMAEQGVSRAVAANFNEMQFNGLNTEN